MPTPASRAELISCDRLGERKRLASLAAERRAMEGGVIGRIPLGYLPEWDGEAVRAVPDPVRAPLVRQAFSLAARRKSALRSVLAEVTKLGLTNEFGRPLGLSSLHLILTNPFYVGEIRYKGQVFAGRHAALVSRTAFARVRKLLKSRRK